MRKVKIEVKTIYNIRFDFHDFLKIFVAAKNDRTRIHEFENFDLEDTTMGNVRKCYESLGELVIFQSVEQSKQKAENLQYIVRELGFDGIENYGGFFSKDDKNEYHITVYNRGADI